MGGPNDDDDGHSLWMVFGVSLETLDLSAGKLLESHVGVVVDDDDAAIAVDTSRNFSSSSETIHGQTIEALLVAVVCLIIVLYGGSD